MIRRSTFFAPPLSSTFDERLATSHESIVTAMLRCGSVEARFDDREIIVELIRTAEASDVLDEFIHHRFCALTQRPQIADASGQIPGRLVVIKDFKDTVAKDEQTRSVRDVTGISRKVRDSAGRRNSRRGFSSDLRR